MAANRSIFMIASLIWLSYTRGFGSAIGSFIPHNLGRIDSHLLGSMLAAPSNLDSSHHQVGVPLNRRLGKRLFGSQFRPQESISFYFTCKFVFQCRSFPPSRMPNEAPGRSCCISSWESKVYLHYLIKPPRNFVLGPAGVPNFTMALMRRWGEMRRSSQSKGSWKIAGNLVFSGSTRFHR